MTPRDRIVTATPLQVLWTDCGELSATRGRRLDREAIRELMRRGPVHFVVATVGAPLRWISKDERFKFWQADVAVHLCETDRIFLDDFRDGVAYVASEWLVAEDARPPIVLLEVHH